ncbi:unnamed protein product [Cyclocybe aegerita]|uniref:Ribosomal RNA-processing protein 42 n=1 Tax=Cyclocybe aegerita TaxID=1973307 RepID=A0A8S0VUC9_CYCAE|nr:unnamed protein product [Cyclocybe aegerita]
MTSISISKAERSYIQAGVLGNPPSRADTRSLTDFRTISLETGVAPLANGSARLSIGRKPHGGSGGTEILAATKLEVESIRPGSEGVEGGRVACTVTCSPAAYSHLSSNALDDLQYDLTTVISTTLTHASLHPSNLAILRGKKAWLLNLDLVVLADAGNVFDALFMAARAALCDTKVPRTRNVEYKARKGTSSVVGSLAASGESWKGDMDLDEEGGSGFDTRSIQQQATDFELPDYWDEGEPLDGQSRWPICVTLNIVPPVHFLDATSQEEAATQARLLLMFAFESEGSTSLQGMRTLGSGEFTLPQTTDFIKEGEKYAKQIWNSLNAKLKDEGIAKLKERTKF